MEYSLIDLDIYKIILSYADWLTLQQIKQVNSFLNDLSKKELKLRLKSKYPFGEKNAKICITTDDINLHSISVLINSKEILIPKDKYPFLWVRNVIISWFTYSNSRYILTGKLFKAIIRVVNKKLIENNNSNLINEDYQVLIFRYLDDGKTILDEVL